MAEAIADRPMKAAMSTHVVMLMKLADCFMEPNWPFASSSDAASLCASSIGI